MKLTQTQSGKAFEYAIAYALSEFQAKPFVDGSAKEIAHVWSRKPERRFDSLGAVKIVQPLIPL